MAVFEALKGTTNAIFAIGKPSDNGPLLKNTSGDLNVRNTADTNYGKLLAAYILAGASLNQAVVMLDLQARIPNIEFSFNGASAPSAGDNTAKFGLCHTTGGIYTAGQVVYDTGAALVVVPTEVCRTLTTAIAITGTVNMIDNGLYALEGGNWILKGDGTPTNSGLMQVVELAYAFDNIAPTSTTSVSSGARVVRVSNKVTTLFNGTSPTVSAAIGATTIATTTDSDLKALNQYDNLDIVDIGSSGVIALTVTISGSTAGAGKFIVEFSIPAV